MRQRLRLGIVLALAMALPVLGRLFPSNLTWGVDHWGFLPGWLFWVFGGLALVAVGLAVLSRQSGGQDFLTHSAYRLLFSGQVVAVLIWSLLLFGLFFLFRSNAPVFGDGYTVVVNSKQPLSEGLGNLHEYLRPLSIYLYRIGHALLSSLLGVDYRLAFAGVSALGGVLGTLALWILAGHLGRSDRQRWFIFLVGCSSGCMLLWFGYLELYTWPTTALLWLIISALAFAQKRIGGSSALATVIGAALIHMLLLPLGLWMLFVAYQSSTRTRTTLPTLSFGMQITLAIVLVSGAAILYDLFSNPFVVIPILAKAANPYTAFSAAHLVDMANLLLFCAPLGLLLLLFSLNGHRNSPGLGLRLTIAAAVYFLLYAFWTDPLMGVPRDWDLVSLFGFPVSLWGAAQFAESAGPARLSARTVLAVGLAALLIVGPAVAAQHSADYSAKRMDRLLWNDPHYRSTYDNAYRCISWGWILTTLVGDDDAALRYYERRVQTDTTCALSWQAMGTIEARRGNEAKAVGALTRAVRLAPDQIEHWFELASNLSQNGRKKVAYAIFRQLTNIHPTLSEMHTYAGLAAFELGDYQQAVEHFRTTLKYTADDPVAQASLGIVYVNRGVADSALLYLRSAYPRVTPQQQPDMLRAMLKAHIMRGDRKAADSVFATYSALVPNAPDADQIRSAIDQIK